MVVPIGMLQPPLFWTKPKSLTFGAFGIVVGKKRVTNMLVLFRNQYIFRFFGLLSKKYPIFEIISFKHIDKVMS